MTSIIDPHKHSDLNYTQLSSLIWLYNHVFGPDSDIDQKYNLNDININERYDLTCKRFLVAKNWNHHKAKEMIHSTLKWREANKIDRILLSPFSLSELNIARKYLPMSLHKSDRQGHPVLFLDISHSNIPKLRDELDDDRVILMTFQLVEYIIQILFPKYSREFDNYVTQIVVILDMKDLSFHKLKSMDFFSLFRKITKILSSNYPELLHSLYFINASSITSKFWFILKLFMSKYNRNKASLLRSKQLTYLSELMKSEDIPSRYGGLCNCQGSNQPNCYSNEEGSYGELVEFDKFVSAKKYDRNIDVYSNELRFDD